MAAGPAAVLGDARNARFLSPASVRGWLVALAFASGAPALVYQVVWTREVALLAGSNIEAISVVLAAFFGGLALGAHRLGALADRVRSPLALYALLEVAAGLLATGSTVALRALDADWLGLESPRTLLAASAAVLAPVTFLLGGTLPALVRAGGGSPSHTARVAGVLLGANTAGAVTGVWLAVLAIPRFGLEATTLSAGATAVAIGVLAWLLSKPVSPASPVSPANPGEPAPWAQWALLAAGIAGLATLGYEVLSARLAALQLGSSLLAWGLVLGLFLAGLAAGNLASARWAARTRSPALALGWVEVAAAACLVAGAAVLRPDPTRGAPGVVAGAVAAVVAGVLPPALAMGAAFPFFVRLGVRTPRVGAAFGRVSAANTAGGILGALLAPFVLLPFLGSTAACLACGGLNAAIGVVLLASRPGRGRPARLASALAVLGIVTGFAQQRPAPAAEPWAIFVADGPQATAVVATTRGQRDLLVNGDPEASTGGDARRTELLLAALPLLLHPEPRSFLELGLGSGITLGTARRFPLDAVECVELSRSVHRAAAYFVPDNRDITNAADVSIERGDARIFLGHHRSAYDVIAANTLHPWSLGATGLYSAEYFERLAQALRPDGIAVQWVPVAGIAAEPFELILRTFFASFPHGGLWWGAGNVIAVGARAPLPELDVGLAEERLTASGLTPRALGLADAGELAARRIASAASLRSALGPGAILTDDLPRLEVSALQRRPGGESAIFDLLVRIAEAGLADASGSGGALLWLESRAARSAGDTARADGRERLAAEAGFAEAARASARRRVEKGFAAFQAGDADAAEQFRSALADDAEQRDARYGLAGLAIGRNDFPEAARQLEQLLELWPEDPQAWNELGGVRFRQGRPGEAQRAFVRALELNPFYPEALANAGLVAKQAGDTATARLMLERLRALAPLGASPQEQRLAQELAGHDESG